MTEKLFTGTLNHNQNKTKVSVNYIYMYASRMHMLFGEQSILRNLELCMEYRCTCNTLYEPRPEKICHRGLRPGPTQDGLYSNKN